MPWKQVELMKQRQALIEELLLPGANVSKISNEWNISRKTAYKWLERYEAGDLSSLCDKPRTPHTQPSKTSADVEQVVFDCHNRFPYWGPRKLRHYIANNYELERLPSVSTMARILDRQGCEVIKNSKSAPATTRFEREQANDLWQMDFKGSFMTEQHRCFPLTIIDDHSRYSIGLEACRNEESKTVKGCLTHIFKRFGLPLQINTDNGNPWGVSGMEGYTALVIWLIKLGVRVSHSAPFHPQTNGKNERFHRTLKLEVLHNKQYQSCHHIQKTFRQWQHLYNYERPHDALAGHPPASRYHYSSRQYCEKNIKQIAEYDEGEIVRKADVSNGLFTFKGRRYPAGKGLRGEYIAIRETAESGVYAIFFMDTLIKKFHIKHENIDK